MNKVNVWYNETVVNRYEVRYDKEKLEELGYESLSDYLMLLHSNNVWSALSSSDGVVTDVLLEGIQDFIDTNLDSIDIDE